MIFWNVAPYSSTASSKVELAIAQINAINPGCQHANYTICTDAPWGGQHSYVGSIARTGVGYTVRVNTVDQLGNPTAPDATISTGLSAGQPVFIFYSDEQPAYNGGWVPTAVGATWWEFTASGDAASAADVAQSSALCAYQWTVAYQMLTHIDDSFWLRKSGTTGRRTSWTSQFGTFDINLTGWAPTNAAGRTAAQELAKVWSDNILGTVAGLTHAFVDNLFCKPRNDVLNGAANQDQADWKRSGTPQHNTDADVLTAYRQGQANVMLAHKAQSVGRAKSPNIKVLVNIDSPANFPEAMAGVAEAALLEGVSGYKGWEFANTSGAAALAFLEGPVGKLLAPGDIVPMSFLASATDYQNLRLGFALAKLRDSTIFCPNITGGTGLEWFDEFDAGFGSAVDVQQSAPTASGLYVRRWQGACVVVNATAYPITTHELDAEGWHKLAGTQDPTHNDGTSVTAGLTVPPMDGFILVK